jgi:predicted DNA-binding transcriptional regulator AlpA
MNFTPLNEWLSTATMDTIITEKSLADLLGKHPVSVKRAVRRGELPPPTRLFGQSAWTAQAIREHLAARLEYARREAERTARRISVLAS